MYPSDWHIHSEASFDASLKVEDLLSRARHMQLGQFGISDHVNLNTPSFRADLKQSRQLFEQNRCAAFHFGVELTPLERPLYAYCAEHSTCDGYRPQVQDAPHEIELALTHDEIRTLGIQYVIGAAHWGLNGACDQEAVIREWHRQQMYLAADPRINIVGHPWHFIGGSMFQTSDVWKGPDGTYSDKPWFGDFTVIPRSMHAEFAASLIEHDTCVEANAHMIFGRRYPQTFYRQYNEYLRYLYEKGVRMTYGSDAHGPQYPDDREQVEKALGAVGFKTGDFSAPCLL